MPNMKCKACGRRYSYHNSDLCPQCGAYNRPPHRMRVDFDKDGKAELLNEREFLRQSEAGKKREKVCYERKECHEEQARMADTQHPLSDVADRVGKIFSRMEQKLTDKEFLSGTREERNQQMAIFITVIVFVCAGILFGIVNYAVSNRAFMTTDYSVVETVPEDEVIYVMTYGVGENFSLDDCTGVVEDVWQENGQLVATLLYDDGDLEMPELKCWRDDGSEDWYFLIGQTAADDGRWEFRFEMPDGADDMVNVWLYFPSRFGEYYPDVQVDVTEYMVNAA